MKRFKLKARRNDAAFFAVNPMRYFRARRCGEGDMPVPVEVALFADDGTGTLSENNFVVIKRMYFAHARLLFAVPIILKLKSDRSIIEFLISRNIDPITFKCVRRN